LGDLGGDRDGKGEGGGDGDAGGNGTGGLGGDDGGYGGGDGDGGGVGGANSLKVSALTVSGTIFEKSPEALVASEPR
jgi:hypothetical protein